MRLYSREVKDIQDELYDKYTDMQESDKSVSTTKKSDLNENLITNYNNTSKDSTTDLLVVNVNNKDKSLNNNQDKEKSLINSENLVNNNCKMTDIIKDNKDLKPRN